MMATSGRAVSASQSRGRPISSESAVTNTSILTEDLDGWPENLTFAERQALAYRIRSAKSASRPISTSTVSSAGPRNISSAESVASLDGTMNNTSSVPTLPVIAFASPRPPSSLDKGRIVGGVTVPGSLVASKEEASKSRTVRRPQLPESQPVIYCKVGEAQTISARPAVLHFGGFTLDNPWTQTLIITNTSDETLRVQILHPATPQFSIACTKKGRLPPGTQEAIKVTFTADSWQYFYDSIKIHSSSSENILIPLHAYPTMNEVIFPPFVDLGNCPLGETVSRTVRLQTKVPLQFQFAIDLVSSSTDRIQVQPLSGMVSAGTDQDVTITYTPTRPITSELIINISVSQYGFVPIRCRIIGSCYAAPDPFSTRELSHIPSPVNATLVEKAKNLTQSLKKPLTAASPSASAPVANGITSPSPPPTNPSAPKPRRSQVASPRKTKALRANGAPQNGVPSNTVATAPSLIRTRSAVNPLDYSEQPLDNLLFPGGDRKSQESNFLKQFSEYAEHEKLLEINPTKLRIGQKLLTKEQVDELRRLRDHFDSAQMRAMRDAARTTSETVAMPPAEARVLVPSAPVAPVDWSKFFPTPNNAITDWHYRQQIVRDFQSSVTKAMTQQRVDKRLARLKAKIAAESGAVEAAATDEGAELAQMFGLLAIDKAPGPMFPKEPAKDVGKTYDPISLPPPPTFRETAYLSKVTLPTPSEYKLLGYPKFDTPSFPHHVPSARPALKAGATEEYFDPAVASIGKAVKLDPSLVFEIPAFLKERLIPAPLDVLRSSPSVTGVYQRIPQSECEPSHAFLYPPLPFSAGLQINDTITTRHKNSDVVTVLGPAAPTVSSVFLGVNYIPTNLSATATPSAQLLAAQLPSLLKGLPAEDVLHDPNLDASQKTETAKAPALPDSMDEAAALLLGASVPPPGAGGAGQVSRSRLEAAKDTLNEELRQRQIAAARKLNSSLSRVNQKIPKETLQVKPLAI